MLVDELPRTFAALERGQTTEWRAMIIARETIWLSRADRAAVDVALADRLPSLGDCQAECETKKLAYRLDPLGFVARSRAAASGRRVGLRPAPDTMTRLTALLPAAQGVASYAALLRAADAARAAGDERGRGQVMADTLVERVTGQATADQVPVHIELVMTDCTLFRNSAGAGSASDAPAEGDRDTGDDSDRGHRCDNLDNLDDGRCGDVDDSDHLDGGGDHHDSDDDGGDGDGGHNEPAHLVGLGPIPAGLARDLAGVTGAPAWLRRLYRNPTSRQLAAMDSRARVFPERIRAAVIRRDQMCRTPWCGAPIRHADHARSVARGGETSLSNGQGLCEACNYAKQAPGWYTAPGPGGAGELVSIVTPTGHTYNSRPPDLPGDPHDRARPTPCAEELPRSGPSHRLHGDAHAA